jgi:hypothetical protein
MLDDLPWRREAARGHLKYCCALNTTSPGQSRGRAGASLLTAVRLSQRVDLLTRLITCHWATRDGRTITALILSNIAHARSLIHWIPPKQF